MIGRTALWLRRPPPIPAVLPLSGVRSAQSISTEFPNQDADHCQHPEECNEFERRAGLGTNALSFTYAVEALAVNVSRVPPGSRHRQICKSPETWSEAKPASTRGKRERTRLAPHAP